MRIDHIEAINLRYEYPRQARFRYAGGTCTARGTTLILVHTDTGQVGVGSAYSHPGLVYLIVRDQLAPALRGAAATDVETLWARMYALTRWYGRKGAALSALGGVDMALWDLRGKAQDRPLWAILGGVRGSCAAYASGLLWDEVGALAGEARRHVDAGFRRVKLRQGRSEQYDRTAVETVRAAIGAEHDLMVDASMRYHPELARRMGRFLESQRVFWYEEPFPPEELDAYADLVATRGVPIAAGENEFGYQGFRELVRTRAVDIVQPDASRCGGVSEVVRVARLARSHGLRFAPHSWSDAVAVRANAQVVAALPHGITVEVDRTGTPFIEELLHEPLTVRHGRLDLGSAPGLGVDLNMRVVDRYRMPDPLRLPEGSYSDLASGSDYQPPDLPYVELAP